MAPLARMLLAVDVEQLRLAQFADIELLLLLAVDVLLLLGTPPRTLGLDIAMWSKSIE